MNRREIFQVAAGTAVAHSLVTVLGCGAESAKAPAKSAKDAHAHPGAAPAASPVTEAMTTVALRTSECVLRGETCLEHCLRSLASGSTMMASCAQLVQQMLPVCRAMSSLAAMGSPLAKDLAPVCKKACANCLAECEKHADHDAECGACAAACKATLEALAALG